MMAGGNNYYFSIAGSDIASSRCAQTHTRTNIALFHRSTLSLEDGATGLRFDPTYLIVARSMLTIYKPGSLLRLIDNLRTSHTSSHGVTGNA